MASLFSNEKFKKIAVIAAVAFAMILLVEKFEPLRKFVKGA